MNRNNSSDNSDANGAQHVEPKEVRPLAVVVHAGSTNSIIGMKGMGCGGCFWFG